MMRISPTPSSLGFGGQRQSNPVSLASLLVTILLAHSTIIVKPEIIDLGLDMIIDASSDEVHFVRGFLKAPASIDLSKISWITDENIQTMFGDDQYNFGFDDEASSELGDDFEPVENEGKGENDVKETQTESPSDENGGDGSDKDEKEPNEEDEAADTPVTQPDTGDDNPKETQTEAPPSDENGGDGSDKDEKEPEDNGVNEENEEEGEAADTPVTQPDTGDDKETQTEAPPSDENGSDGNDKDEKEPEDNGVNEENKEEGEAADTPVTQPDTGDDNPKETQTEAPPSDENGGDGSDKDEKEPEDNGVNEENKEEGEAADTPVTQPDTGDDNPKETQTEAPPSDENGGDGSDKDEKEPEDNGVNEENEEEGEAADTPVTQPDTGDDKETQTEAPPSDENGSDGIDKDEKEVDKEDKREEPTTSPTKAGGDRRLQSNNVDIAISLNQVVDIALFLIPVGCEKDRYGKCDWVTLGVGSYDEEMQGGMSYCCSTDTSDRGKCKSDDVGKLIIDHGIFQGDHREIQVPSKPFEQFEMDDPIFDVKDSGDYVMVIANCDDNGFGVITLGEMEWKSVGGYLPGDMFDVMFFYGATTAIFLVLGLWYYFGMRMFQDDAIPIQKYILATIILGFLGTIFKTIDLLFWNINGTRSPVVMYIALVMEILFQGLLRCLGVMVAMGWGVVRDTLGMALCKIILLGLMYSGLSLLRDSLTAAASSAQLVSTTEKEELIDLALVLSSVIICINIIFYCWIISSLKSTTEYLRNMNQTSKLRRHLRLRFLIITSLIIISALTAVTATQFLVDFVFKAFGIEILKFEPILGADQVWIIEAVGYGNYLFILFGVTILWRPNADAKDYAMQLQLPSVEDDENDLELSCVVPSADDVDIGEGYKIDDAVPS